MSNKRSIFEEVNAAEKPSQSIETGAIDRGRSSEASRRWMRRWLMLLFTLVVIMIAVGGLTRLTDSGLSITEWKPITGAIPPMYEAVWLEEFEKYKQIPEYELQNVGMIKTLRRLCSLPGLTTW